jgi:hypothetical protein
MQWKNQRTQFEISTKFYVIQFHRISIKGFTIAIVHVSHKSIVMTFLVRECYGSPKKQEF